MTTRSAGTNHGLRAVLLAGGKGTRLHPYTAVFPKPLMPLGDMPVIELLLRQLKAHGFTDMTICTGHLAELLMAFCGGGERFGVRIEYSREDQPLGTAGPLALAPNLTDPVIAMNGDLLTTLDFTALLASHEASGADATIAVYPREVRIDFGVLKIAADGALEGYDEKPVYHFDVSMGVYVLRRSVIDLITPGRRIDIPDLIAALRARGGRVNCFRSKCYWLDIGRADDYSKAQEEFARDRRTFLPEGGE